MTAGGNPLNDAMEHFAKQLAEKSRGRIKVDVHITNALAKGEGAHLEGVQLGTIDVVRDRQRADRRHVRAAPTRPSTCPSSGPRASRCGR